MNSCELLERVETDMRQAMKDRDTVKTGALKGLLARLSNAESVDVSDLGNLTEVPRKQLSLIDRQEILRSEIKEIQEAVDSLEGPGKYKADLERKGEILRGYLP